MSVRNAVQLLRAIDDNPVLKEKIYFCEATDQVVSYLKLQGYQFKMNELEDAIRDLRVQCRTPEDLQHLRYKAEWLLFLTYMNENTIHNSFLDYD
jgi:predicted ribosomally synthesized peptide with nif11-like leader